MIAALYGKGVDNALIEIDNDEVPIIDGSAKFFVEKIDKVGLDISDKPIKIIKTIRTRLGLDISNEIVKCKREISDLKKLFEAT